METTAQQLAFLKKKMIEARRLAQRFKPIEMERKIIVAGQQDPSSPEFRKLLKRFLFSGCWAMTPQHRRSRSAWCKFVAPKIRISAVTLRRRLNEN
jgi:hypothetical protein